MSEYWFWVTEFENSMRFLILSDLSPKFDILNCEKLVFLNSLSQELEYEFSGSPITRSLLDF